MSHPDVNGSVVSGNSAGQEQGNHQPSVRHIPIYVEGRPEPVINKNLDTSPRSAGTDKSSPNASFGESGGLFSRVKGFPVRSNFDSELFGNRSASPGRTVPVKVHQPPSSAPQASQPPPAKASEVPEVEKKPNDPMPRENLIGKIEKIQQDVLSLIDQVEKFSGCSRKDRQYMYLDEMLTQNLLKLDTIDADGQETIKQARRNAIKCINQCIAALEQKTDAAAKAAQEAKESEPSQK